ncbi:MAG TPA: PIG-L family deacetylase [Vicinamibacteria bacterium]|nr:PIG-L family deacetylase [Vicinamibacteria bacterium]
MRHAMLAGLLLVGAMSARAQEPAPADDRYGFAAGRSQETALRLQTTATGARFVWNAPAGWDTALLGIKVTGTAPQPRLDVTAGAAKVSQHFEAEPRGLRWLNLTGLKAGLTGGAAVEIQAQGLTLDPAATLRTFANKLDLSRTILVLAPHPDDAEIGSFGLWAGRNATIVTVTSGNAGDANYAGDFPDPAQQYLFKGYLRSVDSVTVPWQGGIPPERCFNLGYFDARLKTMRQKPSEVVPELYGPNDDVAAYRRANIGRLLPSTSRKNSWAHLVEDLQALLKKVDPAVVIAPHPYLDNHADHQYTTVALAEALARWNKPATFLLYTNHAASNLYPYGPAGSNVSLPPLAASLPGWAAGSELPVQGVYSHAVSADLQRRKLYALETMHDLRLSPVEQASCGDPSAPRRPDFPRVYGVDYFRRGPRPDEVFLVYDRDALRGLIGAFVAKDLAGAEP